VTFRALLKRLKKHYPSVRAFAAALDVDPSHLSRAMSATGQPFDVRGCLRLATVTGANAGEVLRAAGKGDIADLIEHLYGPSHASLTPEQQQLLDALSRIGDPNVRRSLIEIASAAAEGTNRGSQGGTGGVGGVGGPGGGTLPPPKEPDYTMAEIGPRRVRTGR
jgi:hypothetical protein